MVRQIVLAYAAIVFAANAASITPIVIGKTSTQAVFSYTAPDDAPCSVVVKDEANVVAHDTDVALFPGSDTDNRAGNIVSGRSRVVVVGKRRSDAASDGKMYSRALEADSPYTLQVTCGASTGTLKFRTNTVSLGNSAPDPYPFDGNGYGNYAYPTVDYGNTARTYIDPQTGVLLKRLTTPGYGSPGLYSGLSPVYAYDLSGTWTNPQKVLGQDNQFASYSGPGGAVNALFVSAATFQAQRGYMDYSENYIDDMLARLNGYGDQTSSADRTMNVCLTADAGQTCLGNTLTLLLPKSSAGEVTGPGSYPSPFFAGWGAPQIQVDWLAADFAGADPSVTASHQTVTNTTPLLAGTYQFSFPADLKPSTHIHIAGSAPVCPDNDCTIAAGVDATHLRIQQDLGASFNGARTTLAASLGAGSNTVIVSDGSGFIRNFAAGTRAYTMSVESEAVTCSTLSGNTFTGCSGLNTFHAAGAAVTSRSFILTNFGLKIWKQTGTGTVYLDSVKYDYATSADYFLGYEGEGLVCSGNVTATYAADGVTQLAQPVPGKTCTMSDIWGHNFLYFFDPASGELRTIARLSDSGATQDTTNPLMFYQYNAASGNISTCSYDAAAGRFRTLPIDYNAATNPYFSCGTMLTEGAGNDVISQIKAKYPQIDMSYWGQPQFGAIQGGIATFQLRPTQNAMAWGCYFDVTKPAGQQLVYCGDTWSHYPLRWGGMHGGYGSKTPDGWIAYALMGPLQSAKQAGIGQYTMQVNQIYNNGSLKSVSSTFMDPSTCEALGVTDDRWLAQGATGKNCIKVNVKTEPVNTNPSLLDMSTSATPGTRPTAWPHNAAGCGGDDTSLNCWSYLQPIAEGDWLRELGDPNGDLGAERFLVAKKTTLADGSIDLVLSRAASASPVPLCIGAKTNHPAGFQFLVDVPFGCGGNEYWTKASDSSHAIYADNPVPYGAHTNLQYDASSGSFTQWTPYLYALGGYNPGQYGFGYGVRSGTLPGFFSKQFDYGLGMLYTFSGSIVGLDAIQTHPGSLFSYDAMGNRTLFGLDGRPLGGAGGGDPLVWYHNLAIVSNTQHVYKISLPLQTPGGEPFANATLERKRRAMVGWYGHTLLRDISGPNSRISDDTPDTFCIADLPGECVPGSQRGEEFVSVVNADVSGQCLLSYTKRTPCLAALPNEVGRFVQYDVSKPDPTGARWRVLTSFWGGPGRTNNYANVHGTDGADWMLGVGKWVNGVRSQIYGAKLPSWQLDSQYRGDFIKVPVKAGGRQGDKVRIRFGYDANLRCTTRQEACSTGAANNDPFAWESEPVNWTACDNGCTVTIPAIGNRVLYYVIDRKDTLGNISSGVTQAVAVN